MIDWFIEFRFDYVLRVLGDYLCWFFNECGIKIVDFVCWIGWLIKVISEIIFGKVLIILEMVI